MKEKKDSSLNQHHNKAFTGILNFDHKNNFIDIKQCHFSEGILHQRKGDNLDGELETGTPKEEQ